MKARKMRDACERYGKDGEYTRKFRGGKLTGRDHVGDLGIDKRIYIKINLYKSVTFVNWSHVVQ